MSINRDVFDELFVLEMADNHWGKLERGRQIVTDFSRVVRYNNVRAAIKVQFQDVDTSFTPALARGPISGTSRRRSTRACRAMILRP